MRFDVLLGGEGWLPTFSISDLCKLVCGKRPTTPREIFYCLCLTGNGTALLALVGLVLVILYRMYFPAVIEVEEHEFETERLWQEHERRFGYHSRELRDSNVVEDYGNMDGHKMIEVTSSKTSSEMCQQNAGSTSNSDDQIREHEE
eukprot:23581_1